MENEDADFADIEHLKEALAGSYREDYEDEEFENIASDDEENTVDDELTSNSNSYVDFNEIDKQKYGPDGNPLELTQAVRTTYCEILQILEKQLQVLLKNNDLNLKKVEQQIDTLQSKVKVSKTNWSYVFGMPYFKDRDYFPCPPNEDYKEKLAKNEFLTIDAPPVRQWSHSNKNKLKAAIKSEEVKKQVNAAKNDGASMDKIDEIKKRTLDELVGSQKIEYDWMKISVQNMENDFTPEVCRAMWFNYLHPTINRSKWTAEESEKLIELVNLHNNQNWDLIAEQLGTNRTGLLCMCYYQTKLNKTRFTGKWTKEEDEYLSRIIESCRIGTHIPWGKVTSLMEGRGKRQVFNRWAYTLDPKIKRERFTKEEDMLLVAAVRRYGTDNFQRIASFLPGRTSVQVRDRYYSYLKYHATGEPWKPDEDSALMNLTEEYGVGNWCQISKHFDNRSRIQVRNRYITIKSWMKKQEGSGEKLSVPTHGRNVKGNREEKVWNSVQSILHNMKSKSSSEMNDGNLMMLKQRLNLQERKRRGRKLGQKKVMSNIEKQYRGFFRSIYPQFSGNEELRFSEEETQNITEAAQTMLQYFKANLKIPESDSDIVNDSILDDSDKIILRCLRNGNGQLTEAVHSMGTAADEAHTVGESNSLHLLPGLRESAPECEMSVISDLWGNTVRTYARKSESMKKMSVRTYGKQLPHGGTETAASHVVPSCSETLQSPSIAGNVGSSASELSNGNAKNNSVKMSYTCPPNHATLVGFRTLLLSRRNVFGSASQSILDTVLNIPELPESEDDYNIAAALWEQRLFSLFTWPAAMSNIEPLVMDDVFTCDNEPLEETTPPEEPSTIPTSEDVKKKIKKPKTETGRKRKRKVPNKKKRKITPPEKKRKYEKTGKYKKVTSGGEVRRSVRRGMNQETESCERE